MSIYSVLEVPFVYNSVQFLLAPGAQTWIARRLKRHAGAERENKIAIDIGCGPASLLFGAGFHPIGVDLSHRYMQDYREQHDKAVVASATALPFQTGTVDEVWSTFLLHHLSDELAHQAISEMVRICRPGGQVVVCDGVYPRTPLHNPMAYFLRRYDRGRFMRTEESLTRLFQAAMEGNSVQKERFVYSLNGLEGLIFRMQRT